MPRVPKKNPRSGSMLLGQELRRLRGARTLRDICNLTTSPGLTGRVAPIAVATLSEIESGKALPQLHTLHALSIVFRVSMSQLMAYVIEEKLASLTEAQSGPTDPKALAAEFAEVFASCQWAEALQVAMSGERIAATEGARLMWRANRAGCLMRLGLAQEAFELLTDCCESPLPEARQRFHLFNSLATCHADAGDFTLADVMAREARSIADAAGLTPAETVRLDLLRVEMTILRHESGHAVAERVLREHLRLAEDVVRRWDPTDACNLLRFDLYRCRLVLALGNTLLAERDAEHALTAAREFESAEVTTLALETLAIIRVAQKQPSAAIELLEEARRLCEAKRAHDNLFEVNFRLYMLLKDVRPGAATASYRRCEELFPLLSSRTPLARKFEVIARTRG